MRVFVGAVIAIGALCLWIDLIPFDTSDPTQFLPYFVMSALAAGLRVSMSTYRGTLPINFLFVWIGLVHLTLSELVVIGGAAAVIQCLLSRERRPDAPKILFNLAVSTVAVPVAELVYRVVPIGPSMADETLRLAPAALALSLMHTIPVAIWEGRSVCRRLCRYSPRV